MNHTLTEGDEQQVDIITMLPQYSHKGHNQMPNLVIKLGL